MEKNKIGFGEALCILLIVVLSHIILTFPKTIIESQGTGSLLNIIYLTVFTLYNNDKYIKVRLFEIDISSFSDLIANCKVYDLLSGLDIFNE